MSHVQSHTPLVPGVIGVKKDCLLWCVHDLVRGSQARDARWHAMQRLIFLYLIVVEEFYLGGGLRLVLRLGIVQGLGVQRGGLRTERAADGEAVANLLNCADAEEVVPHAVQVGVSVGHMWRRPGGGAGILGGFRGVVGLRPGADRRGENDRGECCQRSVIRKLGYHDFLPYFCVRRLGSASFGDMLNTWPSG